MAKTSHNGVWFAVATTRTLPFDGLPASWRDLSITA